MVYRRQNLDVVSSETPIHPVEILFHLSVSPPSKSCLTSLVHSRNKHFLWSLGQVQYQHWGISLLPTTLVSSLVSVSESVPGHWYNVTHFIYLDYIRLLDVGKLILGSEEFSILPSLESSKPLCNLIYGPTLSWLVFFSPLSLYL